jgi:hypothetical protein
LFTQEEESMKNLFLIIFAAFALTVLPVFNSNAGEPLTVEEFRKLYDSLLAGKTLVNETEQDDTVVKKERHYGKAVNTGAGDFDIPVKQVITQTANGKVEMVIKVNILDRVNDVGGKTLIQEELRGLSVKEEGDEKPEASRGVEFGGVYRVGKNDKGGFDVQNFALTPSLKIDGGSTALSGSMISYSCYPQKEKSVCELNVRDFELGDYEPYQGYKVGEPIGGDYTEVFVSQ